MYGSLKIEGMRAKPHGAWLYSHTTNMKSINQTGNRLRLPNFCNLGVMLRALVAANVLFMGIALIRADSLTALPETALQTAAVGEPALIFSLVVLCALRSGLQRLPYAAALSGVLLFEAGLGFLAARAIVFLLPQAIGPEPWRLAAIFIAVSALLLLYFDLNARALSPALSEARLQALQARIRPHFLYNSLNAALSLIRTEPKRAERALLDLSDLFRVLMADNTTLAPLARELELTRQYLAVETLRLGDRLTIVWELDDAAADALLPPLTLQPLVENAVYHGIEPRAEMGEIRIQTRREGKQVVLEVSNPVADSPSTHAGNNMAIGNIRERLELHFDVEASMKATVVDGVYRVRIEFPYNRSAGGGGGVGQAQAG
jgi:two-component system, LytTR family, sensor histidine kinase AlgZ